MAKVKKMAFGGMGNKIMAAAKSAARPVAVAKPIAPKPVAPKPVMGTPAGNIASHLVGKPPDNAKMAEMASHLVGKPPDNAKMAEMARPAGMQKPTVGLGAAMSKPNVGAAPIGNVRKIAGVGGMLSKGFGMKKGGAVGSASKRADGIAQRGKTRA